MTCTPDLTSRISIWLPGDPATATQQERKIAWRQKRTYLSAAARKAKNALIESLLPYRPAEPYDQALSLRAEFYFQRPKSGHAGEIYKNTKPDSDNLCKGLLDSMQACGYFTNDSRVASLTAIKYWTDTDPGIRITIEPLED